MVLILIITGLSSKIYYAYTNDNVIISPNDFLENNKRGEFYTGHVFGLGYAFVQHLPVEVFSGTDCYHPIIDIQCIDQSEECIQEGFDIVVERLKRKS